MHNRLITPEVAQSPSVPLQWWSPTSGASCLKAQPQFVSKAINHFNVSNNLIKRTVFWHIGPHYLWPDCPYVNTVLCISALPCAQVVTVFERGLNRLVVHLWSWQNSVEFTKPLGISKVWHNLLMRWQLEMFCLDCSIETSRTQTYRHYYEWTYPISHFISFLYDIQLFHACKLII